VRGGKQEAMLLAIFKLEKLQSLAEVLHRRAMIITLLS
jgi:hypothetical protein